MKSEVESGHLVSFRRGLYVRGDIPRGQVMRNDDVIALITNKGVPSNMIDEIINKRSEIDLFKNDLISFGNQSEEAVMEPSK